MRAGLAGTNGRLVRALQDRLGAGTGAPPGLLARPDAADSPTMVIEDLQEDPWASLTFSGTMHRVELRIDGSAGSIGQALAALRTWPDEAGPLPGGHFLAEVQVTETARELDERGRMAVRLRLDALTIEE